MRAFVIPAALLALLGGAAAVPAGELPRLEGYVLGKPGQAAPDVLGEKPGGEVTVRGAGRQASPHLDEGAFAGFPTDALNFTLVARVARVGPASKGAKFGLVIRAGLAGNDKA